MAEVPELTIERMKADFKALEEEAAFWAKHYAEFRGRYPDLYVIVKDRQVIGTAMDLFEVEAFAKSRGLRLRELWIEYMSDPDEPLIL